MLAIFGDFAFTELLLVAVVALMVFGRRLPEVAVRAAAHLSRLRRSLTQMWREAGIEEELRKVRRDVERTMPDLRNPRQMVRDMGREYLDKIDEQEELEEKLEGEIEGELEEKLEEEREDDREEPVEEVRPQPPTDQRDEATEDPDQDRESA